MEGQYLCLPHNVPLKSDIDCNFSTPCPLPQDFIFRVPLTFRNKFFFDLRQLIPGEAVRQGGG